MWYDNFHFLAFTRNVAQTICDNYSCRKTFVTGLPWQILLISLWRDNRGFPGFLYSRLSSLALLSWMSPESPLSCFDFSNLLRRLHEQINIPHRLFEQGFSNKVITRLLDLNKDLRDPGNEGATHLTRSWRHKRQKSALLLQHIPWPKPEAHEKSLAPRVYSTWMLE